MAWLKRRLAPCSGKHGDVKLAIFGLAISSSWGNGHATLWRGLCSALIAQGHRVLFFERDVEWYAANRDLHELPGGRLLLYREWSEIEPTAHRELRNVDAAIVTSYCPDALAATALMLRSPVPVRTFYDLDTPVTLANLLSGRTVPYIGTRALRDYDLVLSYTGGTALDGLREHLGARQVAPLYGSVDPEVHKEVGPVAAYRADLSYLGTFAADRQAALEELFVAPAQMAPERRFVLGGSAYPANFPWTENIHFVRHLPPGEHPAFYSSSRLTLNITRAAMAAMGHCPSARLFEAAACGTSILSDRWDGLDAFFAPGREILLARNRRDVAQALELSDAELSRIGAAARERALAEHTAAHRARELMSLIESAATRSSTAAGDR
jgi:spore maturation protein CgeB